MKINASAKLIILITLLITTLPAAIYLTHTLLNSLKDEDRTIAPQALKQGNFDEEAIIRDW